MASLGDLRSYYETEAGLGTRGGRTGFRVDWCADFAALISREQRRSVIDFGSGPGTDASAFQAAGLDYLGVDLAVGNALLAAERGAMVVSGSMAAPPVRRGSFGAGWSMSALMHVPVDEVPSVVHSMAACLQDGAPLFVGLWGGTLGDIIDREHIDGERRLFSLRSFDQNLELIGACGTVESSALRDVGPDGWEYHGIWVRVSHP